MSPSSVEFELRLQDPRGTTYRQTKIAAKSLLEPFSFDIGGEARTGAPFLACFFSYIQFLVLSLQVIHVTSQAHGR